MGPGADAGRRRGYAVRHRGQWWSAAPPVGASRNVGATCCDSPAARSAGGGSDQIGVTVTGGRRDGLDNRRVSRPTVARRAGSWSSLGDRTSHARHNHTFIVGDPVGGHGSPQSSRLTSASPAGSRRRLRQRRSCRESTSRSPGAGRSARYLLRAGPPAGSAGGAASSELLGGQHSGQKHGGHQPGALLVLGQLPQPVALEQDA